jgi:hypothetical protein
MGEIFSGLTVNHYDKVPFVGRISRFASRDAPIKK